MYRHIWSSLMVQMVKNVPSMQETWVRSLAWEYPLDKGMPPHSSILTWRIPWTVEACGPQSKGSERVRCLWATNTFTFITCSLIYFHRHTHVAIHIPLYKMLTCPLRHQHAYKFIHRHIYAHNSTLRCPYMCILIYLERGAFSCIYMNTNFLTGITKLIPTHTDDSHKNTNSYRFHKNTHTLTSLHKWTVTYSLMKMSLHIHSLKLAHTFTYTHSNMIPVIYNSPCRRYKQHHTYILTGEYAHTYYEVPTFTHVEVFKCTHMHTLGH